jgi:hypothetical protein
MPRHSSRVLSMKDAAALLASPPGTPSLHALAAAAGCASTPGVLARAARDALGLPTELETVSVCAGPGALRALVVRGRDATPPREVVTRIASRLATRTPQLLWLVVAEDAPGRERVIASWSAQRLPPRVVALSVERAHIVDSDAETLCALAATGGSSDLLTHARWLEILGRDALTRRFYRTLERTVGALGDSLDQLVPGDDRRTLALYTLSRLLFLSFLEAKGWLDGDRDYLSQRFIGRMAAGGGFHARVLDPLFFGTLNTKVRDRAPAARALGALPYLNGGLFTRAPLERRWRQARFSDDALGSVFDDLLTRHRLTSREDSTTWSDAAVDPEMLGRAFESLMAPPERRVSGVFFTPHALVERVMRDALASHLSTVLTESEIRAVHAGDEIDASRHAAVRARLEHLHILDPACGSGAFLVHALERVAALLHRSGDPRDVGSLRREVLARSIYGVDASPTAVWLCELRLWLSVVIESDTRDPRDVVPLPNLDHNVRVGDSLAGAAFDCGNSGFEDARVHKFAQLRMRYARACGPRKRTLARALERAERDAAERAISRELAGVTHARRELVTSRRQRDLFGERRRDAEGERILAALRARSRELRDAGRALREGRSIPFSFAAQYSDVAGRGGFDLIVGNPPWVRLHNIPARSRDRLRREFESYRCAAWEPGAAGAGAGRGFAAQIDLSALFVERAARLLKTDGTLALLVPAKLWRSLAGGGLRRFLERHAAPLALEDWSESAPAFDAAVYPSLLVARRTTSPTPDVQCVVHRRGTELRWSVARPTLPLDGTPGSPWLIAPPAVRTAFDRMMSHGTQLGASAFGRPLLGVKCGLNEAFLAPSEIDVEPSMLRPLVRGETLTPWRVAVTERIIWTHGVDDRPLPKLPERARRLLVRHQRALLARSDARGKRAWWSLFRTESASSSQPRVVWADVGRTPRAAFVAAGDPLVALNSCYVARCASSVDALALTALLNSPLAAAWLALVAEPARGGYHRFLGWTMALLPLPRDWVRARSLLAPFTERALGGDVPAADELFGVVVRAYRLRKTDVAPLVAWATS